MARPIHVEARVISFGNITTGGTGKTPAVIERAQIEVAAGHKVAVLTRGYGSQAAPGPTVDGHAWLGDEAALIARKVPPVIIAKTPNRVRAAQHAVRDLHCDVLILDDGFQYLRLHRDENILVIDATNPFGNGRLLPRGILREPLTALRRATHIIVTRCDQVESVEDIAKYLAQECPHAPIRLTYHAPASLLRIADGRRVRLSDLRNNVVRAVCAVGNPEAFFATLEGLGATVKERLAYPDHSLIPAKALAWQKGMIITTEKDATRIGQTHPNVFALGVELRDFVPAS